MQLEKPELSRQERKVHAELIHLAGGINSMQELTKLNDQQRELLPSLHDKGYLRLTRRKFMVVLAA
jgi:hypothetical protein